ncbi:MAG: type II secretion system F family protein [Phycisphaerales bacterium]
MPPELVQLEESPEIEFRYAAVDSAGKRTRGTLSASSQHAAFRKLSADGLTPIKLEPARETASRGGRVRTEDIASLTRELSVLVEARIPVARGLASVAESETNAELAGMVRDIAASIESGRRITDAFAKYADVFGDVYIETLRAAERSGSLAEVTSHLAEMLERSIETRKQMKRALSYPTIVLGFVFLALTIIVVFVVPKFAVIFSTNGVKLPLTTRIVQAIGDSVKHNWYIYLPAIAACIVVTVLAWKAPAGRRWFERLFLRLPHIGSMFVAMTAARFCRVLSISIGSGLDLTESIAMAGRATGRPLFAAETAVMADRMRSGAALNDVMKGSRYLPSFARRMLSAGKDSKELAHASGIVAAHYDRESDHLARSINTLIEPLMTIALAGIVLLVALSVFLPMWQMIKITHG